MVLTKFTTSAKMGGSEGVVEKRYIYQCVNGMALDRRKMAFISGPRQVGKTTFAKSLQPSFDAFVYRNWDEIAFRREWAKHPNKLADEFDLTKATSKRLLVLDEIHKSKGWKTKLKGLYDTIGGDLSIAVTGSARLNVYKKGGDSLMGRYLHFRLHPLSYGELTADGSLPPGEWLKQLWTRQDVSTHSDILGRLLTFSGFPEPYFEANPKLLNVWRTGRHEKIIREDLRDLSRLPELSQVEVLAALLPTKVGSPLSVQSLREDLEVSFDTVKRWLAYLQELYFYFELKPWTASIPRSLKKEGKIYLYDWTECVNEGALFENLIASHLLKAVHFWVDTGEGAFSLHYVRNKEKEEIDFLIAKKGRPWLLVEAKKSSSEIDMKVAKKFSSYLGCPYVQVIQDEEHWFAKESIAIMSASRFLSGLP